MSSGNTRRSKRLESKTSLEESKSRRFTRRSRALVDSDDDVSCLEPPKAVLEAPKPKTRYRKTPLKTVIDADKDVIFVEPQPLVTVDLTDSEENNLPMKRLQESPKSPKKSPAKTPRKATDHAQNDMVTPPKQRKITNDENLTPLTPSGLMQGLSLSSAEKSSKKKLFKEPNLHQSARKALHSMYPTNMPGREKELNILRDFIMKHLEEKNSGTLYISGPPGTGKTASLNLLLEDKEISTQVKDLYINCTAIKSSGAVFSKIVKDFGIKTKGTNEKECISGIESYLKKSHKTMLLVLDEIDQLESKNQSVLYTIFEWPSIPNSKLILIGIANALDLTDRILPRLQARCELKPELMHFAPYTKQQIIEIFTNRLKNADVLDIFSPVALQMLAGKVAAISGDVRRALDIGRRVIEMADAKRSEEDVLKSVQNLTDRLEEKAKAEKRVDLKEVIIVLNDVYGASQKLSDDDDAFPLQQKIIVCSLLLILKRARNKDVTVGRLHEIYRKVCMKRNIQVVDQSEFVGLCSLIETKGVIKIIKKKDPRMNKISLVWDEEEVECALKDKQLMSTILQDDGCLGKL